MIRIENKGQFLAGLDRAAEVPEDRLRRKVRNTIRQGLRRLLARTPVWSGQAVRNYVVTVGAPYGGPVKPGFKPPTPGTNSMPLGYEPHRAAAEAEAWATFNAIPWDTVDPYQAFYITNRSPHIAELEAGLLPTPETSRQPQGMFVLASEELQMLLASGKL